MKNGSTTTSNTVYELYSDHLGTATFSANLTGEIVSGSQVKFFPFGGYRVAPTAGLNNKGFTGHQHNDDLGLIYMNARYYLPETGRFLSADIIVPDPYTPQSFNRYSYVYNNPIPFNDPSGHCPFCLLVVAGVSKLVDYGWTAYDAYWDTQTLADPNATAGEKFMAALNLSLAAAFEVLEPDDMLPIGLPADDLARHALMKGVQEAFEEGGEEAVEALVRESLGEAGEAALKQTDELLGASDEVVETVLDNTPQRNLPFSDPDRVGEINKTLDNIDNGGPYPYKKDATVFQNREEILPDGDYLEYTVTTPGASNRATRRIVVDQKTGRTYYTDDHYQSFIQIEP